MPTPDGGLTAACGPRIDDERTRGHSRALRAGGRGGSDSGCRGRAGALARRRTRRTAPRRQASARGRRTTHGLGRGTGDAEEVRRSTLPKRRALLEAGAVNLPAALFDELRANRSPTRGSTAGDIATLAILLNAFALRDAALIESGRFEGDALVTKGRELRFAVGVNPPIDTLQGGPVRPDLDALASVGWVEVRREGGRTETRLGPRARALQ